MNSTVVRQWRMLVQDGSTAQEQMAIDLRLAQEAVPTFRLFQWKRPACSLGFRQSPPRWIDPIAFKTVGIDVVERPTGGGVAVHGSDLSCSAVLSRDDGLSPSALLTALGETMVRAAARFGVDARWEPAADRTERIAHCLTDASPYAVMIGARKACGFALRRLPQSWLAQGSLLLRHVPAVFGRVMPPDVRQLFEARAISLAEAAGADIPDREVIRAIQDAWWDAV